MDSKRKELYESAGCRCGGYRDLQLIEMVIAQNPTIEVLEVLRRFEEQERKLTTYKNAIGTLYNIMRGVGV